MKKNMPHGRFLYSSCALLSILGGACLFLQPLHADPASTNPSLKAIIAGGGYDVEHNQVAIESNVRYVKKLLSPLTSPRILFTNGRVDTRNVMCVNDNGQLYYRAPSFGGIDDPGRTLALQYEFETLAKSASSCANPEAFLYFTGHGSPNVESDYNNNYFDMWDGDRLTVKRLAKDIDDLPKSMPVTIVMVQCFSGAFGNLLFQDGDPSKPLIDRSLCGFFASVPTRVAAGCTPAINEAEYRDFTSYFMAALSGVDRMGRRVSGADYNRDGNVGMDEAFDYTLLHDESIDTPVCTSDTFVRKFVKMPEDKIVSTPYSQIVSWASPGQKAALDGISKRLKLSGEDRLSKASKVFTKMQSDSWKPEDVFTIRFVRLARTVVLSHNLLTEGDPAIKVRFQQLLAAEAGNPLGNRTSLQK
jgi:hypothetical protein